MKNQYFMGIDTKVKIAVFEQMLDIVAENVEQNAGSQQVFLC